MGHGTEGRAALGTKLMRYNGSAWEAIPGLRPISGPSMSSSKVETTSHDDADDKFRKYDRANALKDGGSINFGGNFLPHNSIHQGIVTDFNNGTDRDYRLYFVGDSGKYNAFSCNIANISWSNNHDGVMEWTVTAEVTGAVTLT